ncbi:MAG: M23 family metallopeptidase [Verrucomicrobiota bacterium]
MILGAHPEVTPEEYDDLLTQFQAIRTNITFPVHSYEEFSSSFGPRIRTATMAYDWHRGIDIAGDVGDPIVAPLDGVFWRYTSFVNGGHTLILRHDFPQTVHLNGFAFDHFYTFYLHLFDDMIATNGMGTDDIIDGWVEQNTVVTQGQLIAELGESGSTVSPHLHLEVRLGVRFSHEFQIDNANTNGGTTFNYDFDPHVHPMLLFEPYPYTAPATNTYTNQLLLGSAVQISNDLHITVQSSNDDMPLLNRFEVRLLNEAGQTTDTHVLDYNLRTGFDTTSNAALDIPETNAPYISPLSFGTSPTNFRTILIVPATWLSTNEVYAGDDFNMEICVEDIWKNKSTFRVPVPCLRTRLDIIRQPLQSIAVNWDSVPGQAYHLETSTNLSHWEDVPQGAFTAGVDQLLLEVPYTFSNENLRYFRTVID